MSFQKKTTKSPADYARAKAKEEEVEEVIDEVEDVEEETGEGAAQDDYEHTEPAPKAPARPGFNRGGQTRSGGREPGKALRLTGLFAGKREGCFSGKLRPEDAANLAGLIQEAQSTNQQIVFFLWENQSNPQFSLTATISAPAPRKNWGGGQGNRGGNFNRGFRRY